MSVLRSASSSSQIHDGFATIRSRGSMHRSRSSRNSELLDVQQRASHHSSSSLISGLGQLQPPPFPSTGGAAAIAAHPKGAVGSSASLIEYNNNDEYTPFGYDRPDKCEGGPVRVAPQPALQPYHQPAYAMPTGELNGTSTTDGRSPYAASAQRMSRTNNSFKQSISLDEDRRHNGKSREQLLATSALLLMQQQKLQQQQTQPASHPLPTTSGHDPSTSYRPYTRPISPTYCNVLPRHQLPPTQSQKHAHHQRSATAYGALFQPTYYRKDTADHPQQYALTKLSPPPRRRQTPPAPLSPQPLTISEAPAAGSPFADHQSSAIRDRPQTLHCQRSYNAGRKTPTTVAERLAAHSASSIAQVANNTNNSRRSPTAYYSNDTNYYSPAELQNQNTYGLNNGNGNGHKLSVSSSSIEATSNGGPTTSSATESHRNRIRDRAKSLLRKSMPDSSVATSDKRFATLSYPRESQRLKQLSRSVCEKNGLSAANDSGNDDVVDGGFVGHRHSSDVDDDADAGIDMDAINTLDYKIGNHTLLRGKPRIPWYELAIRKPAEQRRLSCPPTYEVWMIA